MRISDWSSDVCSFDLLNALARILEPFRSMRRADAEQALMQIGRLIRSGKAVAGKSNIDNAAIAISKLLREELDYLRKAGVDVGDAGKNYLPRELDVPAIMADPQIGRASGRESVCQYGYISGGAVSVKKKN